MANTDTEDLRGMWEFMPDRIQKALKRAVDISTEKSGSRENAMARHCPRCGAGNTIDCDKVVGIGDPTVGLCISCGYVWCLECDTYLISTIVCGHWKVCRHCSERKDESGYCRIVPWECAQIRSWLAGSNPTA
jgi:hypothetical protein